MSAKPSTSSMPIIGYEPKYDPKSIPPFTGNSVQYDSWKTRMEVIFSSFGLSELVKISEEAVALKLSEFKTLDLRLHDLILMCVQDTVLVTL